MLQLIVSSEYQRNTIEETHTLKYKQNNYKLLIHVTLIFDKNFYFKNTTF